MTEKEKQLQVGDPAPEFTLPDQDGKSVSLADFRGKVVVLYFYPKDNTPGCTTEAYDFRDASPEFDELEAVVLGVSKDTVESHRGFASKHELPFTLLSDTELEVCKAYGVWQLKKNFGKESMGIVRSTFLIDRDGKIAKIWKTVKVKGHVDEVREAIAAL